MDKKIVVFDFDKTLTYKDTLFGFFVFAAQRNLLLPFKVALYILSMIIAKLKFISNEKLKRIGIAFFLKNRSVEFMDTVSAEYAKKIKFNDLYKKYDFHTNNEVYIVSASFKDYLKAAFPDHINIIGSEIKYVNNKIKGLKFNCYKNHKVKALNKAGVQKIDELFTDSFNDYYMAKISKKITVVNGDNLFECDGIDGFMKYFEN